MDAATVMVVAKEGISPLPPWKLMQSKKFEGRWFFYNVETKISSWTIDKCFFEKENIFNNDDDLMMKANKEKEDNNHKNNNHQVLHHQEGAKTPNSLPPVISSVVFATGSNNSNVLSPMTDLKEKTLRRPIRTSTTSRDHHHKSSDGEQQSLPPLLHCSSSLSTSSSPSSSLRRSLKQKWGSWGGGRVSSLANRSRKSSSLTSNEDSDEGSSRGSDDCGSNKRLTPLFDLQQQQHQPPLYRVIGALGMGGSSLALEVQNVNDDIDIQRNKTWAMKKIYKSKCKTWQSRLQLVQEIDFMKELSSSPYFLKTESIFEDKYYLYMTF
jgi:hypothetical protein